MTGEAEKDATSRFTLRLCDKYSAKKELKEQSQHTMTRQIKV